MKWFTFKSSIYFWYIPVTAIILTSLLLGMAFFEYKESKDDALKLLSEGGNSLIESILISSENTLNSSSEIENLISEKLLSSARLLKELDGKNPLTKDKIKTFSERNRIFTINIFNSNGKIILSNKETFPEITKAHLFLKPIFSGEKEEMVIGLHETQYDESMRYGVAVKRYTGGAIVLNMDANYLLDFRKRIGIGNLIQTIGANEGIAYIVLQDEDGIVLASKSVSEITRISDDEFLKLAIENDSTFSRITSYKNEEIMEFVKSFEVQRNFYGIFRLGLKMDVVEDAVSRTLRRLLTIAGILIFLGVIIFSFVTIYQNYFVLNREHSRIKTFTGSILKNMDEAIIAVDENGKIKLFNKGAEKLFEISENQVIGKPCSDVVGKEISLLDRTLIEKREFRNLEINYSVRGIKNITAIASTSLIYDDSGNIETAIAVLSDITEIKKLELEARRKDRLTAMGELGSAVAHEIRNPLNAIKMIVQRFEKEFSPKNDESEYLALTKILKLEISRVNGIIEQFLKYARPPKLNLQKTNLKNLIEEICKLIKASAEHKGITLKNEFNGNPEINIDKEQFEQAILNLLRNAIEATGKGGSVSIIANSNGDGVIIEISDTGHGITKDNIDKIFNPYFTTKPDGTGMGLSLTHRIINQHGGEIKVESEIGQGTTFTIIL